ncbi:MAG: endonuclease MutS2 [Firmicutes bacterium]|nr:endonuclease MutS2 [Bacillota bacterium]
MDRYTLKKLEFHKIKEMLEAACSTPLGIPRVQNLEPTGESFEEVLSGQAETSEAVHVLRLQPDLSFEGVHDLAPFLRRAVVGGVLEPRELLLCRDTLAAAERIKKDLARLQKSAPHLGERAAGLEACKPLQEKIDLCLLPGGEIADAASPTLARLRRQIKDLEARARAQLDEVLTRPEWSRFLQEPIFTVRGDRYVVPVKQEYRNQFPGLIHDQSASGATVFMEPLPLVRLMNELAAARAAAQQEEFRILEELTRLVAAYHEEIQKNLELLGKLDFAFAKGRLSIRLKGREPQFAGEGCLVLRGARHPLLKGEVVPLDIRLGKDFDCLVITGPNTGGKTVALKTVGLLVLMAQAGLHIPAEEGTVLPFLQNVFADIGDEQSIEQSLSTFSGHMKNIVRILQDAGKGSLVLLDELGAGTDPEQGAALGMAILEYLMQKGALTIATTHYSELKIFAYARPRAENACVEFDSKTLQPTYRLSIGVPGESNAFEIARRLGLFPEVVARARDFLKPEQRELSELIQHLKEDQAAASAARYEAEQLRREVEQLRNKIQREEEKIREKEREVLTKAAWEARELVRTARREAEQLIRTLREQQRLGVQERLKSAQAVRSKLRGLAEKIEEQAGEGRLLAPGEVIEDLKPGETVEIPRFKQQGVVLEKPTPQGEVMVQVGVLKLNLPVTELRRAPKTEKPRDDTRRLPDLEQRAAVAPELDFRGLRVEEALEKVDRYLDAAYLAGLSKVSLIHGKGTGALREAIRSYLAKHPFVASYRSGGYYEGGAGVTIVEFK